MNSEWMYALWGGVLIGISVSMMLLWNGRVTGISSIFYGMIYSKRGDLAWRIFFIAGLVMAGFSLETLRPETFGAIRLPADWTIPTAGLLVGFGTSLGSGCTSGHGVCGISRLSPRSLLATALFISSGVASVFILKKFGVLI